MEQVIRALREEERATLERLHQIRATIRALGGSIEERKLAVVKGGKGKRRLSAAGREAIAKAARKRWAAHRKANKSR